MLAKNRLFARVLLMETELEIVRGILQDELDAFESRINESLRVVGDTSDTCQRTAIKVKLLEIGHLVNGIQEGDVK